MGDRSREASAVRYLGNTYFYHEPDRARSYYEESLALCRAAGNRDGMAYSLLQLSRLAGLRDESDPACEHLEEALAIWRELGDVVKRRRRSSPWRSWRTTGATSTRRG